MAYPPSWRGVKGDRGTASAALLGSHGRYLGYLNVTPRQGPESLSDWTRFRPAHNVDEGDRAVHVMASAAGLRFRTGRGSCVQDSYATETGAHYVEIACLVAGSHASTVIVGAAPPSAWASSGPLIERAISAVTT